MAVLVEAISVIIRFDRIADKYPGGWASFRDECPSKTLCSDSELVRVGFMNPDDVKDFINKLTTLGLTYLIGGKAQDIVVADQQRGLEAPCDWAEFGRIDWGGDSSKKVGACRLIGSAQTEIFTPDWWSYDKSLTSDFTFIEADQFSKHMDFLRNENGVDVYRDRRTGKEVYEGRISS